MEDAIMKINAEMQKDPQNPYLEIVGTYVIDRCGEENTERAVDGGRCWRAPWRPSRPPQKSISTAAAPC